MSQTFNRTQGNWKFLQCFSSLLLLLFCQSTLSAERPEVLSFSPEGSVKDVRQVRVTFSDPMIPFGDPQGIDPFNIVCDPPGHGRWADPKNWIYDFDKDLPAGIQCNFKIKPGLKTFSGTLLAGRAEFKFDTGGPAIKRSEPWEGSQIDEEQIFILSLDAEADPKSVLQNAYFSVEGIGEKIPVKLIDQDPRKALKSISQGFLSKVKLWAGKFGFPTRVGTRRSGIAETIIQAKRRFPPNAKVTLVWGSGITTPNKVTTHENQTLAFQVRPEFNIDFSCERENANSACSPITPMNLRFNAEVPWGEAKKIRLRSRKGSEIKPFVSESQKKQDDQEGVWSVQFQGPFPENSQFEIILPRSIKDDAGRTPINLSRFPLTVNTGEFPPLIKFSAEFGILEFNSEAVLPVTVRNVEENLKLNRGEVIDGKVLRLTSDIFSQLPKWLTRVSQANREESLFSPTEELKAQSLSIKKPNGTKAFEVMGIPIQKPGFYVLEFESERLGSALLGKTAPMYVATGALATRLSVHFKRGRESSLAWVTTLGQAQPVEGASVSIQDCSGKILATEITNTQGIAFFDKEIPEPEYGQDRCSQGLGYSQYSHGLYIIAVKDDDFTFVHSSWQKGIEPWRYGVPGGYSFTPEYGSTVFDRTLFRAGELVHMKHFFRQYTQQGIARPSPDHFPKTLQIRHHESNQTYEMPLTWRNGVVSENTWAIPKNAKLGVYTVHLLNDLSHSWRSGEFRVEEYHVPLMRGQLQTPSSDLISPQEVRFNFSVEYLSGGPASKLPVQIRYQTSTAQPISFQEFEGFSFGAGKAKNTEEVEEEVLDLNPPTPETDSTSAGANQAKKQNLVLDQAGTGHVNIPFGKSQDQPQNLHVELEYRDPNGETQTSSRTVPIYPSGRLTGIKPNSWFSTTKSLKFQVAVTDLHGKAIPHAPVQVEFVEHKTYSHRKRLVGGFYAYDNKSELVRQGKACSGTTDEKGLIECDTQPPVSGNIILEAKTSDDDGRSSYTHSSTWVYDSEQGWFAQDDSERIDLLPERKKYEVGEKAVFQVRMPFREATALVTVEREGILHSFVTPLSGKKPLIEVPIQSNYAPNVFVSALVVRGRVGDIQPTAMVDLGRPAYKLGIGEIQVGWKPHQLDVKVLPSKSVFQVREKGHFKIQVKAANGNPLSSNSEVAIAAVDEGLLQLKPNESWDLLKAMMHERGYEVQTFTAQSEVIGKRHFGLKALPLGGDGGKAPARQLFDSLLYWNGNVSLNSEGEADIQIPMNDSITGFKIAAVAHSGLDLFGTGYTHIRTTQDLMILSGIPQLAREGDRLALEFTLRNTTESPMQLSVFGKAPGIPDFSVQNFALAAHEAKQAYWKMTVPLGVSSIAYQISAKELHGKASDRIQITQKIVPAIPVRTYQATLSQLEPSFQVPVERPKDALPDRGGIRVGLNSTILTGLDTVRRYMYDYVYTCLEQRVSKAVTLRDKKLWKTIVEDLPSYLDSDGLAKYFPSEWIRGSDILTSYILSLSQEAGWDFPEEIRHKMLNGLKGFIDGHIVRISDLPTSDLTVRKLAALEALSRYGSATWSMTGSLQIQPNLWPTSALIDWSEILKRIKDIPDSEAKRKEADLILRSRLNFQGTTMGFSTENVDQLWWMMVSTSTNVSRFLLSISEDPLWKEDIGRIIRGVTGRQKHGHWDTTTANAWGVLALEKFARIYEKSPVTGVTTASLTGQKEVILRWNSETSKTFDFDWPIGIGTLTANHSGDGKPWITVQSLAAIPLKAPLSAGYRIEKKWNAIEQKSPGKWSKGDIARVHLEMESQSDMTWVVVNDPIPAGSMILGSGLENDSHISASGEKARGWAEPAFQERAFDGYRAYYEYVPKGKWTVEYTIRFNQSGVMHLPSTRVEAMYAPEMFGEIPNDSISVSE